MKPAANEFVFLAEVDVAQILPFQRKMGGLLIYDSYPLYYSSNQNVIF